MRHLAGVPGIGGRLMPKGVGWLWRLAFACAFLLLVLAIAFYAIDLDGGLSLAMGMAIRDGRLPYRDLFENRTPALHYLVAALLSIAPSLWLVRAGLLAADLAGIWLVWRIGKEVAGKEAGRWGALFYLLALLAFQGYQLMTEPFIALLLLAALWHGLLRKRLFVAGVLAAGAFWFKQPALLSGGALLGMLFWQARSWRQRGSLAAGALLALAVPLALLLQAGLGSALVDQLLLSNLRSATDRWPGVAELAKTALGRLGISGAFWALGIWGLLEPDLPRRLRLTLALLIAGGWLTVLPNLYAHYFVLPAAAAAIPAGLELAQLGQALTQSRHRQALLTLVLLPLLAHGAIAPLSVLKQGYLFRQIAFGQRLQRLTSPDEPILVLTYSPAYYFLSERYPPVPTFFLLWVNDTPEIQQRMVASLGHDVHIAVIVDQPEHERHSQIIRERIQACGTLLYTEPALGAQIWQVDGCR